MLKEVYIVEVQSGCTGQEEAMLFDSVWTSKERAEEYCNSRFKRKPDVWHSEDWPYDITKVTLDTEG